MALAKKMEDRIHPAGRHYLHLDCVEEKAIPSQFSKRADGTSDVFFWQFTSNTKDESGVPFTIRHMTDSQITPKNKFTKFWKLMQPKNAAGQPTTFEDISGDTGELEGFWYEAEIAQEEKGDKTFANILFIKPYVKGAAAPAAVATVRPQAPPPLPDDGPADDPFADE
jgi:hypothetical protein